MCVYAQLKKKGFFCTIHHFLCIYNKEGGDNSYAFLFSFILQKRYIVSGRKKTQKASRKMLAMTKIIFDGLLDVIERYTSRRHTKEEPSERSSDPLIAGV
jgi:hypothetical protein